MLKRTLNAIRKNITSRFLELSKFEYFQKIVLCADKKIKFEKKIKLIDF